MVSENRRNERPQGRSEPSKIGAFIRLDEKLAFGAASLAAFLIPFFVTSGGEGFRLPKEILFVAGGIAAGGLLIAATIADASLLRRLWSDHKPEVAVTAGALAWTAIASFFSVQPAVSADSMMWVLAAAAIFIATLAAGRRFGPGVLAIALVPAAANAVFAILQRVGWWSPVRLDSALSPRLRTVGLLGNPNDLAMYLILPLIACTAVLVGRMNRYRWVYGIVALLLAGAIAASESVTAAVAMIAGLFTMSVLASRRAAVGFALAVAAAAAIAFSAGLPIAERVRPVVAQLRSGDLAAATSFRTQAWIIAWQMFVDDPLTGVGPGCFGLMNLPYKILLLPEYPEFLRVPGYFAEAHSDHLQTLAVSGAPGYILLLASLALLGAVSFRRRVTTEGGRFARRFGLPAAVALTVLTLGQFPLELAAPLVVILFLSGVTISWAQHSEL